MVEIERCYAEPRKSLPPSNTLGFGQYFSDHWFFSKYAEGKGWYRSRLEPYGVISMDPAASALHYGQALFEGMKAFRQDNGGVAVFRPEFNFRRLQEGAARLCLEAPPAELFFQGLKEVIRADERWVPREENSSLYIRPTLIGTEGFLGVRPSREVLFFIILSPVASYYSGAGAPVKIWVEEKTIRAAPGGLGAIKAGANYAASLLTAQEAKRQGYSQVLWLDVEREGVEEVGTMNVFFVFNDEIVTPELNGSILPGGVRDSVLQLLRHEGARVSERRVTMREILKRHDKGELLEAFGTGTAAVITSIGELRYRGESLLLHGNEPGPVSRRLLESISGIQRGRIKDTFGWMRPLESL